MKTKANDLVIGSYINFKNQFWKVVSKQHVKPGKGGAYIQAKLKSSKGTKLEQRFSSSEDIEIVIVVQKKYIVSYKEKNLICLCDKETYETFDITKDDLEEKEFNYIEKLISDETEIIIEFGNEKLMGVIFPKSIKVKITSADPVVKGQTAASSYKNATIENSFNIQVPTHIKENDIISVDLFGDKGITFLSKEL